MSIGNYAMLPEEVIHYIDVIILLTNYPTSSQVEDPSFVSNEGKIVERYIT